MSSNPYYLDSEPRGLTAEALGDRIDALMLGVEGHDRDAIAERARRAADLLRPISQRRDAAYAAAAAAGDPAEPDIPERFGPSLAAQVGGDLDRLFHDNWFRDRLKNELLHDIEEWGTVLLDDEDGVRYEFIAPTQEGLQEADHQVLQIQRALSDRGAIPEQRTPALFDSAHDSLRAHTTASGIHYWAPETLADRVHEAVEALPAPPRQDLDITYRPTPDATGHDDDRPEELILSHGRTADTITYRVPGWEPATAPADELGPALSRAWDRHISSLEEGHDLIDRLDGVVRQADLTSLDWDASWHPSAGTASMASTQHPDYDPWDNRPITDWHVELIAARGSRTISVVLDHRAHDLTDAQAARFLDVLHYRASASREDVVRDALRPHLDRARRLPRLGADEMAIDDPIIHDDGLTLTLHPSWTGPGTEQSVGLTLPADSDDVTVRAGGPLTDLGRAGELDPADLSPGELGAVTPDLVGIDGPLSITDTHAAALVLGVSETTMNQTITTLSTGLRQARDDLRALDAERRALDSMAATAETVFTRITRDTPRPDLTIYTTPGCMGCEMTRREADRAGLSYETVDLSDRPDLAAELRQQGLTRAPVVESADGQRTAGFRPDRIRDIVAMASSSAPATAPAQDAGRVPQAPPAVGDRSQGITR